MFGEAGALKRLVRLEVHQVLFQSWFTRLLFAAMLIFSLAVSDAFAQKGGRGRGGRGGGGGDGGARSASQGGGGGGGGRSFSGGDRGGRSFESRGGGGSSMRGSFAPQSRPSFSGGQGGRGGTARSGGAGESSLGRSFTARSRPSFGGNAGSESLGRAMRSMNQGSSNANARRSFGEASALSRSIDRSRPSFRPSDRGSLQGMSRVDASPGGAATRDRSIGRSQITQRFSDTGPTAGTRSQGYRPPDRAVGQAAWAEALGRSRAGLNSERRVGRADEGGAATASAIDQFRRRGGNDWRQNLGRSDSTALPEQVGRLNDARGGRADFRRSENRFGQQQFRPGRATNDEVRNFLSLRDRGGENETGSGGPTGNRDIENGRRRGGDLPGRLGEASGRGPRFGRETDGGIHGGRGRADGDQAGNWRNRVRRSGERSDGIVGAGERGRSGGRDRDGRRGVGDSHRWRGGELGRGDHRDWSGRWHDGKRFDVAHKIRGDWRGRDWRSHHDIPFHGGWWKHHGHRHRHHHHHRWGPRGWWGYWGGLASFHRPYYWWSWSSSPRLSTWFVYDWPTPYYWDYGPGEYIHCYNNVIYVNGQWFEPAPVYYQRTVLLAESAPAIAPEQVAAIEWLPLGVFVVSRDGVVDNNVLVQLAVTKEGAIGGTVLNQATGVTFDISGTVDKQTQRAAWTYVDEHDKQIAMETSIFNLTQPESTALLHNGPEDMKVVQLVRLEEPNVEAGAAANGAAQGAAAEGADGAPAKGPAGDGGTVVAKPQLPAGFPIPEADAAATANTAGPELPPPAEEAARPAAALESLRSDLEQKLND